MYKLSDKDKESIKSFNSKLKENIEIKYIESGSKEDALVDDFLSSLSQSASKITIQKEKKGTNHLPEIVVTDNIRYSAVPLSNELKPFLKALSLKSYNKNFKLSDTVRKNLDKISIPIKLKLFAANACPHCPVVVEGMLDIANECKNIELSIIDPAIFTEEATVNSVLSVPCLILDDDIRWTGSVSMEEVTDVLADRDSSTLKAPTLRRILEHGKASWLADQMIEKNMIFPEFIKLVVHEIWSVRLGAMVVIEELAEKKFDLANTICKFLWEKFPKAAMDVKGDILYAIGESGKSEDIHLIEKELITLETEDLQEAAKDAIEEIKLRS